MPQPSFSFDYSDARLMGVTSRPLHNLGSTDGQVIVLPGVSQVPARKSSSGGRWWRAVRRRVAWLLFHTSFICLHLSPHANYPVVKAVHLLSCPAHRKLSDACYVQLHHVLL